MSQWTADSLVAAGLGIGAADREVHGAADLLVEQDRADRRGRCRSSCRCRSRRGATRRRRWRASPSGTPRRARRARPRRAPSRNSSSMPATSTPRGLDGIVKRIRPSARVLDAGPVKTSPEGMLRLPSELTQVRPLDGQRQVGALGLDAQLARARSAARSAAPGSARSSPHAAVGVVAVEEQRAADERRELGRAHARPAGRRRRRPQRQAPAARAAPPRAPARGRGRRAPSAPASTPRQRARVVRRLDADRGVGALAPRRARRRRSRRGGASRACRPERLVGARQLGADQRPRLALEQLAWSASSSGAASVVERTTTCWPGCTSRQ